MSTSVSLDFLVAQEPFLLLTVSSGFPLGTSLPTLSACVIFEEGRSPTLSPKGGPSQHALSLLAPATQSEPGSSRTKKSSFLDMRMGRVGVPAAILYFQGQTIFVNELPLRRAVPGSEAENQSR